MEIKPIWADYATYDDDGFVNGVREDAPEKAKLAFMEYQAEKAKRESSAVPMEKY